MEKLRRIEQAAAERRLALEGDTSCRAPLTSEDVNTRYFASSMYASVDANCVDECVLSVSVSDPNDTSVLDVYSAEVRRGWDPRSWTRAAERIGLDDTLIVGGVGGMVGASHPPPIMITAPEHIGPWATPPDAEPFYALEDETASCGHPDPNVYLLWTVLLQVSAGGRVQRCEARSEQPHARSSEASCLCEAAKTLRFPAGKPGRRIRFDGIDSSHASFTSVRALQPGTELWVERLQDAPATAKCFGANTISDPRELTAVFDLTSDGGITKVELFGEITDRPTMRWASCLVHEWSSTELPCAPPGVDQLQATVAFRG